MIYNPNNPQIQRRQELMRLVDDYNVTPGDRDKYLEELDILEKSAGVVNITDVNVGFAQATFQNKVKPMEKLKDIVDAGIAGVEDAYTTAYGTNVKAKLQACLKLTAKYRSEKKPTTATPETPTPEA